MKEYRVIGAKWIECAEGYGYWKYEFEEIEIEIEKKENE